MLATVLICLSVFSVNALETTNQNTEKTVISVDMLKSEIDEIMFWGINGGYDTPRTDPLWSRTTNHTAENLENDIYTKTYDTQEEIDADYERIQELKRTATIHVGELEFMIELMEKEDNSLGYYDEETWNNFQAVITECKSALSKDEETIHQAYVRARNKFNELCLYNKTPCDVNNDGNFTIMDVTVLQKAIAEIEPIASSQLTVIDTGKADVTYATYMQKDLVGLMNFQRRCSNGIAELVEDKTIEVYTDNRFMCGHTSRANLVYSQAFNDEYKCNPFA